ncbi:MAG: hypothetical protein ACE5E7_08210 [Anaerolineae bacterium]
MRGCLQFLAGVVAVVFIVAAVIAFFAVNLANVITDREAIKEILSGVDALIVDAAPDLLVESIKEQARQEGLPPVEIDPAVMREAASELVPPEWFSVQAGSVVDTLFDVLETGDAGNAVIEFDARPLLDRLRGQPGQQAIKVVVQSLPPCTEPLPELSLSSGKIEIPSCLPPETDVDKLVKDIHRALLQTIEQNPKLLDNAGMIRVPLLGEDKDTPQVQQEVERVHRNFLLLQQWAWALWLAPLACLFLILILAVRSFAGFGRWWGWPMLIAAGITFLISIVIPAAATALLRTMAFSQQGAGVLQLPVESYARSLLSPLTDLWLKRVYLQAAFMAATGLALIIFGFVAGAAESKHLAGDAW